jgi:hypothetical protein
MPFHYPWGQGKRTRRSGKRGFFEAFLAKLMSGHFAAAFAIAAFSAGPEN